MQRTSRLAFIRSVPVAAVLGLVASGCGTQILAIEVMPPRTDSTCAAPTLRSSAAGRGLLDLDSSEEDHGAYIADLRISATGDIRIDGVALSYTLPKGASGSTDDAADDVTGEQPVGDVLLIGDEDDTRQAIIENVVLLPRSLARALRKDEKLEDINETNFETVVITLEATANGASVGAPLPATSSSFRLDVCEGCLVRVPSEEECPEGVQENYPCRPGQDVETYSCAAPASGGLF